MVETEAFSGDLAFGPIPRNPDDVRAVADWGACLIVSVLPFEDMEGRGASDLPNWISRQGLAWLHLPIKDYQAPDADFDAAWSTDGPRILAALKDGKKVFVHCAAGLGRSGAVVARLLIDAGEAVEDAITITRSARSGAIETGAQETYLRCLIL